MHDNPTRRTRLTVLLIALAVWGCSREASQPNPPPESPPPAPPPPESPPPAPVPLSVEHHHGIDVSVHSGSVDWARVAEQGYSFAFVKATEGVDLADGAFADHWPAVKEAGLVRGAYHFYVTEDDPHEQAELFISKVTLEPGDLAPVVDVELIGHGTAPGLPERLRTFLDALESHYGVKPIIYTSPNFWDTHLNDTFGDHPLWVAEYGVDAPRVPEGWNEWTLWQWQGDAKLDGVEKEVDLSRISKSGTGLESLLVSASPQ